MSFSLKLFNCYFIRNVGSVHGEDLAYILGMPLVNGTYHFIHGYTKEERMLSEQLMAFVVNFAKTGSPGSRYRQFSHNDLHEKVLIKAMKLGECVY